MYGLSVCGVGWCGGGNRNGLGGGDSLNWKSKLNVCVHSYENTNIFHLFVNGLARLINGWERGAAPGTRPGPPAINQPSEAIN